MADTITDRVTVVVGQLMDSTRDLNASRDRLTPTACFIEDLGFDHVELVMALEEEFEIEISDDEMESCRTITSTAAVILKRVTSAGT